jgi:glycerol kinase
VTYVAAIDQGTTSTKALLVDPDGITRMLGGMKHRQLLPQSGWVEHDGIELLSNVGRLVDESIAAGATSIALTNQGETVIAWDKQTGAPICNAIVWQDQRTAGEVEALRKAGLEAEVRALSGLPLDAYFSASKLRWILDHVPEAQQLLGAGRLGLGTTDTFFLHQLTGRYVTDVTTAARTSLMNLDSCAWDERLCQIFGVPIEVLPEIVECDEPVGTVRGAELSVAIVDQVAALYGHGCRAPGDMKVTFGTGAFALMISAGRPVTPGTVHTVCWGGPASRTYAADGGVYTAGAAIEWLIRIGLLSSPAGLDALTGTPAAAKGLYFVPALAGLACPHWDRTATGLWIGLDSATDREDLIKAVLEGIAIRTVEVLEALGGDDNRSGVLSADGGLTRSRYFMQFFAAAAGRPIVVPANDELTAFGAAMLAANDTIPINEDQKETIEPATPGDMAEWRERFSVARSRASGWRRT